MLPSACHRIATTAGLLALLVCGGGCFQPAQRTSAGTGTAAAPAVLHPQGSVANGAVLLQPRAARAARPLRAPLLLESGDWIETGADGKVELRLPEADLRLLARTRVQIEFRFEERRAVCRGVDLEDGELLVRRRGPAPFTVHTGALQVDVPPGATVLVAARGERHYAVCYAGSAEARNVRIRGQTVVRLQPGQQVVLDAAEGRTLLEEVAVQDVWTLWTNPAYLRTQTLPEPPGPAPGSAAQKPVPES